MNRRTFIKQSLAGLAMLGLGSSKLAQAAASSYTPRIVKTILADDGTYMLHDSNYPLNYPQHFSSALSSYRLLIIGDSLASVDWNGTNNWPQLLFNKLASKCPGLQLINAAVGGTACGGARDWLTPAKQDFLRQQNKVDHTIVMMGTNNALQYTQASDTFYGAWINMTTTANSLCPAIALTAAALPPMIYKAAFDPSWVTPTKASLIPAYNQKIQQAVGSSTFQTAMGLTRTKTEFTGLPATLKDHMNPDGVHLDSTGSAILAQFMSMIVFNGYMTLERARRS